MPSDIKTLTMPYYGIGPGTTFPDCPSAVAAQELIDRYNATSAMLIPHRTEYTLCMAIGGKADVYLFHAWIIVFNETGQVTRTERLL